MCAKWGVKVVAGGVYGSNTHSDCRNGRVPPLHTMGVWTSMKNPKTQKHKKTNKHKLTKQLNKLTWFVKLAVCLVCVLFVMFRCLFPLSLLSLCVCVCLCVSLFCFAFCFFPCSWPPFPFLPPFYISVLFCTLMWEGVSKVRGKGVRGKGKR